MTSRSRPDGPATDFVAAPLDLCEVRELISRAARAFAAARCEDPDFRLFPPDSGSQSAVTPSEAVALASALLEAVNVELFEVQLWRSWGQG